MLESGAALGSAGHSVDYLFGDDLLGRRWSPPLRRLVAPVVVVRRVLQRMRAGDRFDVVEVHEPLAAPYCFLRRHAPRLALPPCAVLSHGLEERLWEAQLRRWRVLGVRPPLKSRMAVPLTLLSQARFALRRADQVLVLNEADRAWLLGVLGLAPDRVSRVSSGVEDGLLTLERKAADHVRLLFLGSWLDRKGVPELAAACTSALARHPTTTLSLLGVGTAEDAVRPHFPAEVQPRITVRPRLERAELADALRRHDILLLPSWFEGMPLAVLEGAAAGLAVVATDIAGVRDVFGPDGQGSGGALLVPPHDGHALDEAIERLITDEGLLRATQDQARARARSFTWEKGVAPYSEAYRRAREAAVPGAA